MGQDDSPTMKRMFAMFDFDGSGTVELSELLVGLSAYTGASKQEKLKFAFLMHDEDNNGFVDREEIVKVQQNIK